MKPLRLAQATDKALLHSNGIQYISSSSSSSDSTDVSDEETQDNDDCSAMVTSFPNDLSLSDILHERVECMMGEFNNVKTLLDKFFLRVPHLRFTESISVLQYSHTMPLYLL